MGYNVYICGLIFENYYEIGFESNFKNLFKMS